MGAQDRTQAGWWRRGIVYQVYPLSFQDSDGDGSGDLDGIRSRLDHLETLGVDAIWLSPIQPSPGVDAGYDVSDYCDVDPRFGTLSQFDALVADVHRRRLKLVLDFVPNHTSEQHPWFRESRASRDSARRDWYLWRDPAPGGGAPNNWYSEFGGSAWEWDEATAQYYHHSYLKEQPDLNWRNPAVRAAMHEVLRFWLRRGVDGFRIDAMWHLVKDARWRDDPPNPAWREGDPDIERLLPVHSADQPEVHEIVAGLRRVTDAFPGRVLIGEAYLPLERLVEYYGSRESPGVQMPFNFHLLHTSWDASSIRRLILDYARLVPPGEFPNWVLGNHDKPRIASRIGRAQAGVAAVLLLTLRGTPTLYYGDEIGMIDVAIPPRFRRDTRARNEPGLARDPQRTPMQWDASPNAGFTKGTPWLPIAADADRTNVDMQSRDPDSLLSLYRRLIALRGAHEALSVGEMRLVECAPSLLAYERSAGDERFLVVLNPGACSASLGTTLPRRASIVLATRREREGSAVAGEIELEPGEAVIVQG